MSADKTPVTATEDASPRRTTTCKYDALVVGGGIGGMESALKLGDMGYKYCWSRRSPASGAR